MNDSGKDPVRPLIILVHGTDAGRPAVRGKPRRWWEKGATFLTALESACPGHDTEEFLWGQGGMNSELLRRAGGAALLFRLRQLVQERRPYHLVGHSHGGSVIWHALARSERVWKHADRTNPLSRPLQQLKSWTTIGTPFQDFAPAMIEIAGSIVLLLVALAALVTVSALVSPLFGSLEIGGVLRHAYDWSAPPWSSIDEPAETSPLLGAWYWALGTISAVFCALVLGISGVALLGWAVGRPLRNVRSASVRRRRAALVGLAFAVPWAIITWIVMRSVGGRFGLVFVPILLLAALAATALLSLGACRVLRNWWITGYLRRQESLAARHYGPLWCEIHHPKDEAIAALRCALLEAPRILPRPPDAQANPFEGLWGGVMETLRRTADQFAWRTAMSRIQGNDLPGAEVEASGLAPRKLVKQLARAHRPLGDALAQSADEEGASLVGDVREWLSKAYTARKMDTAVRLLAEKLTFGAAIHTSYFIVPDDQGGERAPESQVLAHVAAHITGAAPGASHRLSRPVVEAFGLHRRLTLLRSFGAVAAIVVLTALYGLGHSLVVTPLQRSTQIDAIMGLPFRPGALATHDSPVVAAFLVRLAAAQQAAAESGPFGSLRGALQPAFWTALGQRSAFAQGLADPGKSTSPLPSDVAALLDTVKRITEPNVRAVVGQRLAFAYGLTSTERAFEPVAAEVSKWPESWQNPGYTERTAHLILLSQLAGAASGGRSVTSEEAQSALAAWRVLPCEETDRDAAAAMATIALAAAGNVAGVATLANEAAERREGRCEGIDETAEARSAWIRAFLIARAADVLSWEPLPQTGGEARRRSSAEELLARDRTERSEREASVRRQATALALLRAMPSGDQTPTLDLLTVDARAEIRACTAEVDKLADTLDAGGQGSCGVERKTAAATIRTDLRNKPALVATGSGRLRDVLARTRSFCRTDSPAMSAVEADVADVGRACARAVEANRRIVAAAAVLFTTGDPFRSRISVDERAEDSRFWDGLARAVEPFWRDPKAALETLNDGGLWPIVDVYGRGGPSDPAARDRLEGVVRHIVDSQAQLAGCSIGGPDPCKAGPFALDQLWTATLMLLRVKDRAEDARDLVTNAWARQGPAPCPAPEQPRSLDEPASLLRLAAAADDAGSRDVTIRILDHIACPSAQPRACPVYLSLLSTDATVTFARLAEGRPDLIELSRNCLKRKIARENSSQERARQIQQLARIYMFEDDLYASRDAAERAGAVNFVIAGLCPVLDRERERKAAARRDGADLGTTLREISRWPQPAPVYFGAGPRFTYAHEQPGPLACEGRPSDDRI